MSKDSDKSKEPEKTPEQLAHNTLTNLVRILSDPQEVAQRQLHPAAAKAVIELINEMMNHQGRPKEGMRTIDGMVMYPCPKHGYAPISLCIKTCNHFDGNDNTGVCTCKEERIPGFQQYTNTEARKTEDIMRTEDYLAKTQGKPVKDKDDIKLDQW